MDRLGRFDELFPFGPVPTPRETGREMEQSRFGIGTRRAGCCPCYPPRCRAS